MRGPIGFKFALMTYGQPAVVAVPLRGTLAGIWGHAPPPVLAFLVTDRGAAVLARPLRRARARVRPRAVAAVAARRRADGRRAIGIEPAVLARARVRRDAFSSIGALLDAERRLAVGSRPSWTASAGVGADADGPFYGRTKDTSGRYGRFRIYPRRIRGCRGIRRRDLRRRIGGHQQSTT